MGKTIVTSKDAPGFLVNRILIPMLCEACFALQEGLGTPEDIDRSAKLGLNHPMGPLELSRPHRPRHRPLHRRGAPPRSRRQQVPRADALRNLVAAGWLGKKSGRGFYAYDEGPEDRRRSRARPGSDP
ncbi:MAG: 3-hydroxyacyl-CoA dehydrogenase family protein [Polyangiaceae bacterium]